MPAFATIELRDLVLATDLGTYGPGDVVPDHHALDMTLQVAPDRVLIPGDGMNHVFDYDPLIADIARLAGDGHYETQEWLLSRIVTACLAYPDIRAINLCLRKGPVLGTSGSLGVRLSLDASEVTALKARQTGSDPV